MTIAAIDFARLYRDHLAAAGYCPKPASAWDQRAGERVWRQPQDDYADAFIARMDLSGCRTLLDVGCGSGTLSLPLAARLQQVCALDYSPGMLARLGDAAARLGIGNVRPVLRAWDEDWSDIPACDVVVASRSTLVPDLADALARLHAKALRRVYLTHPAAPRPGLAEIATLLGRPRLPMPDYIYAINLLHAMGVQPHLDYLPVPEREDLAREDFERFAHRVAWALGPLDAGERQRLRDWHGRSPGNRLGAAPTGRWAFIWWEKQDSR